MFTQLKFRKSCQSAVLQVAHAVRAVDVGGDTNCIGPAGDQRLSADGLTALREVVDVVTGRRSDAGEVEAVVIGNFLQHLETDRGNTVARCLDRVVGSRSVEWLSGWWLGGRLDRDRGFAVGWVVDGRGDVDRERLVVDADADQQVPYLPWFGAFEDVEDSRA